MIPAARHAASIARESLTSAPVCERAARTPAALVPPASSRTGLPDSVAAWAARANALPSLKSSQ